MTDAALDDLHATTPGSATRLAPRAWLHTDAPSLSLAGEWDFRWSPVADAPAFEDPDGWGTLPVPSHWVLHGHGAPSYTNVQYPFPIDAPHPPDENPTGDHRRTFTVPGSFDGAARVLLRFDGVESHFRVWLNGQEVGWSTGSRLATEFDVTELLVPGDNELRVRVHQWSAASYLEDQDQWWLPGIFRDVTLLARPVAPIDDVFVRAAWSAVPGDGASAGTAASGRPATGTGTITVPSIEATFPVRFRVPELGVDVTWASAEDVAPVTVEGVEPWSAEVPRLYDATMSAAGETVALRLGFRTVQIVGDRFLVNGERVVFHGVNRHETHPERGRVFDEAHARADMALMKRSNVNAIRTSHYPPHPRVLDLADELGFWVVLECDLETHGFEALGWQGNPSDDPAWEDAYLDRIARTVERDKNHASIVMWSLGNESGTGRNLAAMAQWVHARDTERPVHYEGDYTGEYTDVYSRMYPTLQETESIGGGAATPLLGCGPAEAARQRSKPFLHCEYVHAMGNGPGQIAEYEALVDRYPRLHGGFVWEWRDHGLLAHTADGTPYYAYGGDHHEVVHDGNFVMDGLVLPDDTPTPGLAEFAAVVAPVRLSVSPFGGGTAAGGGTVLIENRYHSASTAGLRFVWTLSRNGVVEASGRLAPGVVAARGSATVPVPAEVLAAAALAPGDELWFEVVAELAGPTAWADTGHVVAGTQTLVASGPARVIRASRPRWDGDRLGEATFTARGDLASLKGHAVAGPRFELWRAPTDNDRGASQGGYETADPVLTGGVGDPDAPSSASRWEARGLDRLTHRLVAVERTDDGLVQRVRVAAANSGAGVEVTHRWTLTDAGLLLRTDAVPFGGWDVTWPRVGVRIDLPAALLDGTVSWFGTGPDESYADSSHAARVGRFEAPVSAMTTRYSMPQETGHRPELRTLTVGPFTVSTVPDPTSGHRAGFTLTPWTAQQVGRAGHPHELPTPDALYLYLDDAQHGLGSRACGLDVLPEHQLWPSARSWSVLLA
ncbi:glycoside hydrolase family 2 TIM barrel-domain containing protein [Curtobacterium sp. MCPF17_050]|uniref:glycoside hydrolase family 2 TIM barrel-domain containing protein n=1 Tax=Curtobacterium sp. MCPF17_050 TaxID=2175664 RepID=UPI000D8437BB|nr:glycoside hydrolase family 2 TIM barrel-domain containing protein [Curtobacterium sp. MCPF17_050]WIB15944.1 glycoside hydrolase family 2 TIM barrel-domain containing protein [Curtobacterium sp. MCPF17_050]